MMKKMIGIGMVCFMMLVSVNVVCVAAPIPISKSITSRIISNAESTSDSTISVIDSTVPSSDISSPQISAPTQEVSVPTQQMENLETSVVDSDSNSVTQEKVSDDKMVTDVDSDTADQIDQLSSETDINQDALAIDGDTSSLNGKTGTLIVNIHNVPLEYQDDISIRSFQTTWPPLGGAFEVPFYKDNRQYLIYQKDSIYIDEQHDVTNYDVTFSITGKGYQVKQVSFKQTNLIGSVDFFFNDNFLPFPDFQICKLDTKLGKTDDGGRYINIHFEFSNENNIDFKSQTIWTLIEFVGYKYGACLPYTYGGQGCTNGGMKTTETFWEKDNIYPWPFSVGDTVTVKVTVDSLLGNSCVPETNEGNNDESKTFKISKSAEDTKLDSNIESQTVTTAQNSIKTYSTSIPSLLTLLTKPANQATLPVTMPKSQESSSPIFGGKIYGTVWSWSGFGPLNRKPIKGATVHCVGIGTPNRFHTNPIVDEYRTTDENGEYSFGNDDNMWVPSPGVYKLTVIADGYTYIKIYQPFDCLLCILHFNQKAWASTDFRMQPI